MFGSWEQGRIPSSADSRQPVSSCFPPAMTPPPPMQQPPMSFQSLAVSQRGNVLPENCCSFKFKILLNVAIFLSRWHPEIPNAKPCHTQLSSLYVRRALKTQRNVSTVKFEVVLYWVSQWYCIFYRYSHNFSSAQHCYVSPSDSRECNCRLWSLIF